MNLIEQLGGYNKLKPHFVLTDRTIGYTHIYLHGNNHYCFLDESVDYIIPDRAILIKDVFDALLEYRRQHNIFEHGDKIIVDWDACQIFTVDLVFPEIRLISALDSSGNKVGNASFDRIKHATNAEIKAGRRL